MLILVATRMSTKKFYGEEIEQISPENKIGLNAILNVILSNIFYVTVLVQKITTVR